MTKSDTPSYTEKIINIPFRHIYAMDNEHEAPSLGDNLPAAGIEGTLVIPAQHTLHTLNTDFTAVKPQRRVVVLAHGQSGHRNYVYQKLLARALAERNGLYTFRFDFRNCGNSQHVDSPNGLTTYAEHQDLTVVWDYLINKLGLVPAALVGHSRGAQACLNWVLSQQALPDGGVYIPTVVNCSGRYRTEMIFEWYKKNMPEFWGAEKYFKVSNARRSKQGGVEKEETPYMARHEAITIAGYDMTQIKYLRRDTYVLTIHGDNDDIIPCEDAYLFADALAGHHELHILSGANHNYVVSTTSVVGDEEVGSRRSLVPEVVDLIVDRLTIEKENERFHKQEATLGSTALGETPVARWKTVEGVLNFRDFGGFPVREKHGLVRRWVRPGILYRCGSLDGVTEAGREQVKKLGIQQVFDFRSETELRPKNENTRDGLFDGPPGVITTHEPLFSKVEYSPEALARRFAAYAANGFSKTYREILDAGARTGAFKRAFEWVRANPGSPFLFHCSAGKDRTGVFAMLVLLLLGVERDTIAHEYELTTVGYAPERERLLKMARDGEFAKHVKEHPQFKEMTIRGWEHLTSSRFDTMIETLDWFEKKYGGVRHYLVNIVGLAVEDLDAIRESLLYDGDPVEVRRTFYPKL
ncbi:uncharacterized protein SAPINGB_P002965 [Magnusiomyces paraingens]|uniref:Tyrosine specific protein phosphatases domain-containing protein n=1 Tax=Magnusiomyces paraingens TaxID=2606893 RepID=A0A5E8BHB6_9ASCO|nr:uncharacterized protein SAPINGB_P002965 [Saprochaete ingens]VVT51044.1 unnamed protein product [Saprochaete ingens]